MSKPRPETCSRPDAVTKLTHIDAEGAARMVDVGEKADTARSAVASARVAMRSETATAIRDGSTKKGDVLAVARIAGIMAAKRTSDLIPLCHPIALDGVEVRLTVEDAAVVIEATARCTGPTGVEMEALTAASAAALTIYDMAKAMDRGMRIEDVRLLAKDGGRSGSWRADDQA